MPSSIPVAYPRLISLNCFLFCFRNSMIDNMREIEKCKAHVQDVEVPLEVFEWVHCCWFPCKLIITTGHYNRDQAIIKSQVCHEHHTIFIRSITKECIETFSLRFEVAKCNITVKKIVLNRISLSKCPGASQNFGSKEGRLLEGGRLIKGALVKIFLSMKWNFILASKNYRIVHVDVKSIWSCSDRAIIHHSAFNKTPRSPEFWGYSVVNHWLYLATSKSNLQNKIWKNQ